MGGQVSAEGVQDGRRLLRAIGVQQQPKEVQADASDCARLGIYWEAILESNTDQRQILYGSVD